jgi:FixJ family two-component response regulator
MVRADETVGAQPTVIVVDDDMSVREALGGLFESVGLRAELCSSVDEMLDVQTTEGPSCLVLDVRLPSVNGVDAYAHLSDQGRLRTPVIFITGHGSIPMSVRAMKAGAVDFLSKPVRDQDLLDAVQTALHRDADRRRRDSVRDELVRLFDRLTPREREILRHVVAGRLNKQIAADLGLSEITVKVHRGNLMKKTRSTSVAELVRNVQEFGLLQDRG